MDNLYPPIPDTVVDGLIKHIETLRAENARLENAVTELTEENRLVGLQMDRFADEIERLLQENERLHVRLAKAHSFIARADWMFFFKEEHDARKAMGESDG